MKIIITWNDAVFGVFIVCYPCLEKQKNHYFSMVLTVFEGKYCGILNVHPAFITSSHIIFHEVFS